MDSGDWIALAAAIIAIFSMAVSIWQAREARESRYAAQVQAAAAKDSADIAAAGVTQARRSAKAAEMQAVSTAEQAELTRRQVEMLELDRHAIGTPQFEITWNPTVGSYGGANEFNLSFKAGPALLELVTVRPAPGSDVQALSLNDDGNPAEQVILFKAIACGVTQNFRAAIGLGTSIVFYVNAESNNQSWGPISVAATQRTAL